MTTISDIQQAILGLSDTEYAELLHWLREQDWARWDREFEEDARDGRLDWLAEEALQDMEKGDLKAL